VGDTAFLDVRGWNGTGLVTTLVSSLSDKGLIYSLTIDEHCPRLFTFFSTMPPTASGFPVFVGTWGNGVWTRQVESTTWSDSSTGLENLFIKDLFIKNGIFGTTAGDGYLYARTLSNSWIKYNHPSLTTIDGTVVTPGELQAEVVSISPNNTIIAGYNTTVSGEVSKSFVLERDSAGNLLTVDQVVVAGEQAARIVDLEAGDGYNIVSIKKETVPSGVGPEITGVGYRTNNFFTGNSFRVPLPPDSNSYAYGPPLGYTSTSTFVIGASGGLSILSSLIIEDDTQFIWYLVRNGLVKIDPISLSSTKYSFITPSEWSDAQQQHQIQAVIKRKSSDTFTIVVVYSTIYGLIGFGTIYLRHYELSLNTGTLLEIGFQTSTGLGDFIGGGLIENNLVIQCAGQSTINDTYQSHAINYNLSSQGFSTVKFDEFERVASNPIFKTLCTGDEIILTSAGITYDQPNKEVDCGGIPPTSNRRSYGTADMVYYRVGRLGPIGSNFVGLGSVVATGESEWIERADFRLFSSGESAASVSTGQVYIRYGFGGRITDCDINKTSDGQTTYIGLPSGGSSVHEGTPLGDITGTYGACYNGSIFYNNWTTQSSIYSRNGNPYWITRVAGDSNNTVLTDATNGAMVAQIPSETVPYIPSLLAKDDLDSTILVTNNTSPEGRGYTSGWGKVKDFDTSTKYTGTNNTLFYISQGFVLEIAASSLSNIVRVWKYADPTPVTQLYGVYKHIHDINIIGSTASDLAAQQTQGNFELIYPSSVPLKVEISKGAPTVIYSIPAVGSVTNSILAASISNTLGSFYEHIEDKQVWEAKVFDLSNPSQFPTTSGIFTETDFERYIGIVNNNLEASKYDLSTSWVQMKAGSGIINHLETTNYHPSGTYFFFSYSGAANFFQKNPTESVWRDYSSGLPASEITVIRCDDTI
jgi:hypothetical protein